MLWDGLQDEKFWTRMWSLMGIAEFNQEVSLRDVEQALGDARGNLISNYFRRFLDGSTAGQRYILRHVVKLLDERGRLTVLKVLEGSVDVFTPVYLAAGTMDPGQSVRAWAESRLMRLSAADREKALAIARGEQELDIPESIRSLSAAAAKASAVSYTHLTLPTINWV